MYGNRIVTRPRKMGIKQKLMLDCCSVFAFRFQEDIILLWNEITCSWCYSCNIATTAWNSVFEMKPNNLSANLRKGLELVMFL
jgi:hypothetical protein